jgi:nucleotide-binding universal stress UspA family protein
MKSILVFVSGQNLDHAILKTALAAAHPTSAHLRFLHIHMSAAQIAMRTPHSGYASGPALVNTLAQLENETKQRSATAAQEMREFCKHSMIEICDNPATMSNVTASWHAEQDSDALERSMFHARHNDLIVVARRQKANGLPYDFLELLILGCGRPVLVAGSNPVETLTGTILVCWRETAEAARAVSAAMPLLRRARRVVVANVDEKNTGARAALSEVARQLALNDIKAEIQVQVIAQEKRRTEEVLLAAARDCNADLIVMGAYGHSRARELIFGGCTQAFIIEAEKPILFMH